MWDIIVDGGEECHADVYYVILHEVIISHLTEYIASSVRINKVIFTIYCKMLNIFLINAKVAILGTIRIEINAAVSIPFGMVFI